MRLIHVREGNLAVGTGLERWRWRDHDLSECNPQNPDLTSTSVVGRNMLLQAIYYGSVVPAHTGRAGTAQSTDRERDQIPYVPIYVKLDRKLSLDSKDH